MVQFRIYAAFFAGIAMLISTVLVPVAYFGDKNSRWAVVAFIAALVFLVAIFYGV